MLHHLLRTWVPAFASDRRWRGSRTGAPKFALFISDGPPTPCLAAPQSQRGRSAASPAPLRHRRTTVPLFVMRARARLAVCGRSAGSVCRLGKVSAQRLANAVERLATATCGRGQPKGLSFLNKRQCCGERDQAACFHAMDFGSGPRPNSVAFWERAHIFEISSRISAIYPQFR